MHSTGRDIARMVRPCAFHRELLPPVAFNNGEFAVVEINGTKGVEKGLFLRTTQISPEDTNDVSHEEFQQRFPVGIWLDITTITEITPAPEQEQSSRRECLQ